MKLKDTAKKAATYGFIAAMVGGAVTVCVVCLPFGLTYATVKRVQEKIRRKRS